MQRLDAAVKKFREAGKSLGGRDWQARVAELAGGAAAGDQLYAGIMKLLRKGNETGLV